MSAAARPVDVRSARTMPAPGFAWRATDPQVILAAKPAELPQVRCDPALAIHARSPNPEFTYATVPCGLSAKLLRPRLQLQQRRLSVTSSRVRRLTVEEAGW
jgi:hypothetical protein